MTTMDPYTLMKLNKAHLHDMMLDAQKAASGQRQEADQQLAHGRVRPGPLAALLIVALILVALSGFIAAHLGLLPIG